MRLFRLTRVNCTERKRLYCRFCRQYLSRFLLPLFVTNLKYWQLHWERNDSTGFHQTFHRVWFTSYANFSCWFQSKIRSDLTISFQSKRRVLDTGQEGGLRKWNKECKKQVISKDSIFKEAINSSLFVIYFLLNNVREVVGQVTDDWNNLVCVLQHGRIQYNTINSRNNVSPF